MPYWASRQDPSTYHSLFWALQLMWNQNEQLSQHNNTHLENFINFIMTILINKYISSKGEKFWVNWSMTPAWPLHVGILLVFGLFIFIILSNRVHGQTLCTFPIILTENIYMWCILKPNPVLFQIIVMTILFSKFGFQWNQWLLCLSFLLQFINWNISPFQWTHWRKGYRKRFHLRD